MNDFCLRAVGAIGFPIHRRPLFPQAAQRFVQGNARDPRAESGIAAERIETGKGADVGFLNDIFRLRIIAQDAARDAEQTAIVTLRKGTNRGFVALARQINEFLVG